MVRFTGKIQSKYILSVFCRTCIRSKRRLIYTTVGNGSENSAIKKRMRRRGHQKDKNEKMRR